jgi:hypothetical protein
MALLPPTPLDKFIVATRRRSSAPIDHTRGRASIVNGAIVYSPNCGRNVNMPPRRIDIQQFHFTSSTDVDTLREPLWWSEDTAFLAFLPLNPEFNGVPFELFNNPSMIRNRRRYTMESTTSLRWRHEEFALENLIKFIRNIYGIPMARRFIPVSAIQLSTYEYPSMFRRQIKRIKGWLSLYMAELAYAIAGAQEVDEEDSGNDALPKWFGKLKWDQVLLSGIRSSVARYTYFVERVGVFLNLIDEPPYQVSIDFLLKYCIPVWYRWTAKEISVAKQNSYISRLAPLPEQLQCATQFLTKNPSSDSRPIEDRPWVKFFEQREHDLDHLYRSDGEACRQRRIDRERNPPEVNTKVFVWERDSNGKFVRHLVYKRQNEETLSRFSSSEKTYCAYWNEWDCCHAFGSTAAEKERDDWFDSEDDDLDLPEVDASDLFLTSTSENPVSDPPPTAPPAAATVTEEPLVRWEPHFRAPDSAHTYDVETYPATEVLHYFFGFVPPIPVPRKHPRPIRLTDKDYQLFAAIDDLRELDEGFRDSTIMQYCHQFVMGLQRNNTPPNELFNLALGNPKCLLGVERLRCFRRRGDNLFSLLLPARVACVPWDLTVTNAIDVLFLCRLDGSMSEIELCHVLIQRGMQFHTLLLISRRQVGPSPIPPRVLPVRGAGYVFSKIDYDAYIEERVELLRNTRVRQAALMTGGIVWRLVVSEVSFPEVFHGPTTATTIHGLGLFLTSPKADYSVCDDLLAPSEAEALSGRVYCYTGMRFLILFSNSILIYSRSRTAT